MEIDKLQPNTIYELTLKAYDESGHSSPFSEKIESRTFEDGNANAPDQILKCHFVFVQNNNEALFSLFQST